MGHSAVYRRFNHDPNLGLEPNRICSSRFVSRKKNYVSMYQANNLVDFINGKMVHLGVCSKVQKVNKLKATNISPLRNYVKGRF